MKKDAPRLAILLFAAVVLTTSGLPAQEIQECSDDNRYRAVKRAWICIDFYDGSDAYFLQRLQYDLGPGKDADTINFSFNGRQLTGVKRWVGVVKNRWSNSKVDITFFSDKNGYVMLSFMDHSGNNLITLDWETTKKIRSYIRERISEISYVKAKDGVSVRSAPSLKAPVIQKLSFGDEVLIIGRTKKFSKVRFGGKTIKCEWIRIVAAGADSAYVNDIELVQKNEIPVQFLLNHGRIHYYNFQTLHEFDTQMEDKPISPERWDAYTDSIGKFFTLSMVDISLYEKKKISNRYRIDTTDVTRKVVPGPGMFNSFYLPINAGTDSIHIHDIKAEATSSATFVGQLKSLNKYVVQYYFESPGQVLYDKTTGEQRGFTEGVPYFSPDGKYVIDFYKGWSYPDFSNQRWRDDEDPTLEWCQLSISKVKPNLEFSEKFSVEFDYWIPVVTPNSAFWVSDRELIIKAISQTNKTARQKNNAGEKLQDSDYQYIKVKIIDH